MDQIEFIENCYDRMNQYYSDLEEENKQLKEELQGLHDEIVKASSCVIQIAKSNSEIEERPKETDNKNKKELSVRPHWLIHLAFFFIVAALIVLLFMVKNDLTMTITIGACVFFAQLIWAILVYLIHRIPKDSIEY